MISNFFYTNGVELGSSNYDINIKFLRVGTKNSVGLEAPQGGTETIRPTVLDEISVVMSPSHAKALFVNLSTAIKAYERDFGTIPVAKEVQGHYDSLLKKL